MNCKDYRESIAADPSQSFDGAEHASACKSCGAFRDEMLALERRIAKAMELPVPQLKMPELPPIGDDDSNVSHLPFRGRMSAPVWLGLAASLIIVAVFGVRFTGSGDEYPSLGAEIMAHLDHEPGALRVTDKPVSERRLAKVVRDDVSEFDRENIGLITYARTCVINGHKIPHLVIQGERGPVTLLLLPDETTEGVVALEGKGVRGVILSVGDGKGSVAIIGERDEPINDVEQRVIDSVKWRI